MPAPGNATILIVDHVEDLMHLDGKGHPQVNTVITAVTGCKLAPGNGIERQDGSNDYSRQPWRIATPPHPRAEALKTDGLIWYDDGGRFAGRTQRATYQDPMLGERDVAEFQVTGVQVLTDLADAVDHVTIHAKTEVG